MLQREQLWVDGVEDIFVLHDAFPAYVLAVILVRPLVEGRRLRGAAAGDLS